MSFIVGNRQRTRLVDLRLLRRIAVTLLRDLLKLEEFDLGLYVVDASEMTRLNETFLRHKGSTDVIAFDYTAPRSSSNAGEGSRARSRSKQESKVQNSTAPPAALCGEIFICLDEALVQARRYRTTWQHEMVRYLVHGLLHLRGYDDRSAPARCRMKREEDRLLRQLASQFTLEGLGRRGK